MIERRLAHIRKRRLMQINRIDDETMQCFLTPEDILERGLTLDEASYSSPVMRSLIRDLAIYMAKKCDFGTDEAPASVTDVIPMPDGGLEIIFSTRSQIDDADPRFSVFTDGQAEEEDEAEESEDSGQGDQTTLEDILRSLFGGEMPTPPEEKFLRHHEDKKAFDKWTEVIYEFDTLGDLMKAAYGISSDLWITWTIYISKSGSYIVQLRFRQFEDEEVRQVCNVISEYGYPKEVNAGTDLYIQEHCEKLCQEVKMDWGAEL